MDGLMGHWCQDVDDSRRRLLRILQGHQGKHNAVTSRQLSMHMGLSTRDVRDLISQLVSDGELIGASVNGASGGYYMINDEAELEETRAILRARAARIFERDRKLCSTWIQKHGRALQPLLPGVEG